MLDIDFVNGSELARESRGRETPMRFNKLDLNLLVALDHLLHLRSVSGAAARMNMTQSAMSNALLRLRDYFDDELLVKIGRRMELTPRAEALKDAVRDVLVRVEWTIATTSEFDPAHSDRQFNVLVSDYTLATLIPQALALLPERGARRPVQLSSPGRRAGAAARSRRRRSSHHSERVLLAPSPFGNDSRGGFSAAIVWNAGQARAGQS